MKRTFTDLHLRLNGKDPAATQLMLKKVAVLGYKLVSVPCQPDMRTEETAKLKDACKEVGMNFASRVNLRPRNPDELLSQLRRLRRKFEVICVLCESKEVARQAAKDRRVDLLSFPLLDFRRRFFDRAEAELARAALPRWRWMLSLCLFWRDLHVSGCFLVFGGKLRLPEISICPLSFRAVFRRFRF